jgi:restriction system protein
VSRKPRHFARPQQLLPSGAPTKVQSTRAPANWRIWVAFLLGITLVMALYFWLSRGAGLSPDKTWLSFVLPAAVLVVMVAVPLWRQQRSTRQSNLQAMQWSEFQPLLCQLLEQQGYSVRESGNRPGMVDLVLSKDRRNILVHAKSWRSGRLGMDEVRGLHAAMVTRSAHAGMLVSCDTFGRNAMDFARETQIMLVDGALLHSWVQKHVHQSTRSAPEEPEPTQPEPFPPAAMDTNMLSEFASTSTLEAP